MCDCSMADSKESAGAPEEIEVTPAMIEAGIEALDLPELLGPSEEELGDALGRAFIAMSMCRADFIVKG
jgi:hypothetical protein